MFGNRFLRAVEQLTQQGEPSARITPDRIAATAGLSRATFYNYFGGKAGLLQMGLEETVEGFQEAASAWQAVGSASTQADVRLAIGLIIDSYLERAALLQVIYDESTREGALRDRLNEILDASIDALRRHIERGQREGWIDSTLLPSEVARWSIATVERGLTHVVSTADPGQLTDVKNTLAEMAWHLLFDGAGSRV